MGSGFKLFWYFQFFSFVFLVIILFIACLGLRLILKRFVLYEAEQDAVQISAAIRDSEISRFFQSGDTPKQYFSISKEKLSELDNNMRTFLAPFDIVKIKIFDSETRIVYSTDPAIIGRMDPNNAKLLIALSGIPISKHETKDKVWDIEDEERKNVEIVETYVPMYGSSGQVIGSFEIYKDVTCNLVRADKILFWGGGLLSVTVLFVFIPLTFVLHRAIQTIKISAFNLTETNEQLQQEAEDRKRLEKELLSIIERERQRIGQELHDSIGQQLTGIVFMIESLGGKLTNKSLGEESAYTEKINTCVSQAVEQTRNLAKGLHPIDLERNGLVLALQELADNTEHLFNISCVMKCEEVIRIDDIAKAINLYRITQEAITNAIKHGKANNIKIELTAKDNCLTLMVKNDGLDFPAKPAQSKGMGLKIMQYRAEILNGSLDIHKGTDGGTVVTCVFTNKDDM